MQNNLRWKVLVILAVVALAVAAIYFKGLSLGLDLQGGVHLVLQVKTDDALRVETETAAEQFKRTFKDEAIPATVKITGLTEFMVEGIPSANDAKVRQLSDSQLSNFDRAPGVGGAYSFKLRPAIVTQTREGAVAQAIQTIERRVNELGVSEPIVASYGGQGGDQIIVQLPGVKEPERAQEIIKNTAMLEIKLVVSGPMADEKTLLAGHNGVKPPDTDIVSGRSERGAGGAEEFYLVEHVPVITGNDLRTAKRIMDNVGAPAVGFTLKPEGSVKFGQSTTANVGKQLAIILDGRVQSAPRVINPITTPEAEITGTFTQAQADDLALVLRSGALPASLTYLEKREVGPSLGKDSIRAGVIASVTGLAFVGIFMLIYYKLAGINALVSVGMNLLILLGFMAQVGAVMTLPGIAGFILTIGMGVDSNVLIFERIREELVLKKGPRQAIAAAFDRVFGTILDTHIASLISAAFLFQFGTGPIRGFATTLFFGLLSNVFTAVFVSRTLFEFTLSKRTATAKLSI